MKTIPTEQAVGMPLAHDLTQIIPGEFKGPRYKKGHIVQPEDIPVMLSMGKEQLFVLELDADDVHEDKAGMRIAAAAAGSYVELSPKGEGKVELLAACDGLLKIDTDALEALIDDDAVMFATIHQNRLVKKGEKLAGTRIIPLYVKEEVVQRAQQHKNIVSVLPILPAKIGILTTGSEIFRGRIKDSFGEVLRQKFGALGCEILAQQFADDDEEMIAEKIRSLRALGAQMIAVTGGMSVDPDDRTPAGIRRSGAQVECYGAPVLPGAMFLLAYLEGVPVVGLPGCVMYHGVSIFDLVIPRLLAGEHVTRGDIKKLGHGGLCCGCETCVFPNCGFGKG